MPIAFHDLQETAQLKVKTNKIRNDDNRSYDVETIIVQMSDFIMNKTLNTATKTYPTLYPFLVLINRGVLWKTGDLAHS